MRIFVSTGEPSGDLHAANLVKAIRARCPDAEFVGLGGPRLAEAGATVLYPLVDLAVMWIVRVLLNIRTFFRVLDLADAYFRDEKPDAVILIDYPGFHWWVAKRAKARGIPVFYYVPPQIWAWAGWRVEKVRRSIDHVLCSLPFEPAWYHARGVKDAVYIGHPYFDELAERPLDETFLDDQRRRSGPVVALLPGSRTQEVKRNLPMMLRAAAKLSSSRPGVRFAVACLHDRHQKLAGEILIEADEIPPHLEIFAAKTPELIRRADVAWAVSGSVGLELMVEALPTVVVYKIRPFDLFVARQFIKSRFISLVNLLADAEVMPEYLTERDVSTEMAAHADRWLADPAEREKTASALATLRDRVAVPGASDRAAERILTILSAPSTSPVYRGPISRPLSAATPERARA